MRNKTLPIDERLGLAASLVRQGAYFADVGTDHAYLPLHLLSLGKIRAAVASDVAKGPLLRAEANVRASGEEGRVFLVLADGLKGMEGLGLTDIAICGMGGEMISEILRAAEFVRSPSVRLILQPMTRVDVLRSYLAKAGFAVFSERYAVAQGRPYVCLGASYDGVKRTLSRTEALLGDSSLREPSDSMAFAAYLALREREALACLAGKREGGADTREEEDLLAAIAKERDRHYEGE